MYLARTHVWMRLEEFIGFCRSAMAPLNSIQYEQIEVFRIQVNVFILRINHEAEWSVLSPPNFCNFNVKKYMTMAKN